MTSELKAIEELVVNNGTDRTIVIIFLAIVVIMFGVFLKRYFQSQDRQERRDEKINENYIEMIQQMTTTITKNNSDIGGFKEDLKSHSTNAACNFKEINGNLNSVKDEVVNIAKKTEDLATKKDLTTVERKIDEIIKGTKKD